MPISDGYTDLQARAAMLPEIDVPGKILYSPAPFNESVNWGSRYLADSSNAVTVDYENQVLKAGAASVSWGLRILAKSGLGGTAYDWQSGIFTPNQTFSGTITNSTLTASRAVVSDGGQVLVSSATTATEIGFVNGVTSAIQTQINTANKLVYCAQKGYIRI